jgi:2',3'-cyclic-nucleotide 2'-phosphodiesterase (5'-nucleotidase family)
MSDGAPLDDNRTYTLIFTDFLAVGGDGLGFTPEQGAIKTETLGIIDLDALISYLQTLPSPVRAPRDERVIIRAGAP